MKHLGTILWLCLYPISCIIKEAISWQFCEQSACSADIQLEANVIASLIQCCIYYFVAKAIFKSEKLVISSGATEDA